MQKVATNDVLDVIAQVPDHLRKLAHKVQEVSEENKELKSKLAHIEQNSRAEGLVHKMEDRGQHVEGLSMQEKVSHLLDAGPDLNVLEAAIDLTPPDGSLVQIGDGPGTGPTDFESFILGDLE